MKKITIERRHLIYALYAFGAILLLAAMFYAGKHCGPGPEQTQSTSIDSTAIDGAQAQKAREADQKASQQIKKLEAEHQEVIEDFDQTQKQEYDRIKKRGPKEVARWLSEFNRGLKQ